MFWKFMLFVLAVPFSLTLLTDAAWRWAGGEPFAFDTVGGQLQMLACQLVGVALFVRAAAGTFEGVTVGGRD